MSENICVVNIFSLGVKINPTTGCIGREEKERKIERYAMLRVHI